MSEVPVPSAEHAIATQELTKAYGSTLAVDRLTFSVERGEIFGFLGPNGAGKTTTMRMLLGLVRPTGGSARMLGMDVATQLPTILAQTGSIIENPTFYPYLSGRENLRVVAKLTDSPVTRIPEVLELVDLSEAASRKVKTYSLGMKQRLAIGAALLNRPDLLILDEPANGLDPAGIVEVRGLMRRLKAEGHSVLISSHVLHEIEQICDRIIILNRGRIVVQGAVESLLHAGSRIEIRIAQPEEAVRCLSGAGWIRDVSRDGNHLLVDAPVERSAEVNELLARQGLFASEIRTQELSLEQYFLDVTEAQQP